MPGSLGGRPFTRWQDLGYLDKRESGTDTLTHQARYAIALHDAKVDVPVSKVPGVCRARSLAGSLRMPL